ncbi:hypothetical protein TEA_008726 [Camellia sinensis var. sinensis]|uniref:V-type proton ATPase proteolipid subunit n=1 Tax=Camellia sinensis var. sinensis TaxID=542762 RepID=A0A4V3WMT6_CAMSN|nr:hypothetical protein TEA_008726 [Camellia sinensis var. sinensis]
MSSTFSGDETAPFFGFLGAAAALVFSCMGAAYGTAKSGVGVASMGVMRPELVMKSIVPVVMAGVLEKEKGLLRERAETHLCEESRVVKQDQSANPSHKLDRIEGDLKTNISTSILPRK